MNWSLHKTVCNDHVAALFEQQDNLGRTRLFTAVEQGDVTHITYLLKMGMNVSIIDKYGMSPLHIAARDGNVEIIQLLQSNGADVNVGVEVDNTPLHLAAKHNQLTTILALFDMGAVVKRGAKGVSPMHRAAAGGHSAAISLLHSRGSFIDALDASNQSPIDHAALNGHADAVLVLESLGADVTSIVKNTELLPRVAYRGHTQLLETLIDHFHMPISSAEHISDPVHMAVQGRHLSTLRVLCNAGACVNCKAGNCYPLHWAAENNDSEILECLILNGADLNTRMDIKESTAIHIASQNGNIEALKVLLSMGACLSSVDAEGYTPAHASIFADKNNTEIIRLFYNAGANLQTRNSVGCLPIGSAVMNRKWEVAKLLSVWGSDVNFVTLNGDSPLMIAACHDDLESVRFILEELRGDVNYPGKGGWTALMCAVTVEGVGLDVITELLMHGACCDICNDGGMSTKTLLAPSHPHFKAIRNLMTTKSTTKPPSLRHSALTECVSRKHTKKNYGSNGQRISRL